jgi:hypothetical protein
MKKKTVKRKKTSRMTLRERKDRMIDSLKDAFTEGFVAGGKYGKRSEKRLAFWRKRGRKQAAAYNFGVSCGIKADQM